MSGVLNTVLTATQYIPAVLSTVTAVETAMAGATGQDKKTVVIASIQAGADAVGASIPEAHVSIISKLIDSIVTALNATGWFTKPAAAAPAKTT